MARKRGGGSEEEGGSWMDTYGDMVTLILTFFVLLYSMSSVDKQKFQIIAQAFASQGNVINAVVAGEVEVESPSGNLIEEAELNAGEVPETFDQLFQYLQNYVEQQGLAESVEVTKGASSIYLRFRDNVFFDPDSSVLREEGKEILGGMSGGIISVKDYILGIKINGYTAESASSNKDEWELSSGRANNVLKYMMTLNIVPTSKYSSSGFGKYRPVDTNDTEEGRRQNRRVEIIIARNDADYSDPEVLKEFFQMEFGDGFTYSDYDIGGSTGTDDTQDNNGDEDVPNTPDNQNTDEPAVTTAAPAVTDAPVATTTPATTTKKPTATTEDDDAPPPYVDNN